jgi:hypothetical protein
MTRFLRQHTLSSKAAIIICFKYERRREYSTLVNLVHHVYLP